MRLAIAILLMVAVAAPGFTKADKQKPAKSNKPDFSGKWNVDLKKSEVAKGVSAGQVLEDIARKQGTRQGDNFYPTVFIEHREPVLKVIERRENDERAISEEIYYTDGRGESNTTVGEGNFSSKTIWDEKRVVTSVFGQAGSGKKSNVISARITWELSKDGKTLTKTTTPIDTSAVPHPDSQIVFEMMTKKMVYRRAQG